jgi:hypothetical protein
MLIAILRSLYTLFPDLAQRYWFFWVRKCIWPKADHQAHGSSAAICLATLCTLCPASPLVDLAINEVRSIVMLFGSIDQSKRDTQQNFEILSNLLEETTNRVAKQRSLGTEESVSTRASEHLQLIGWSTRLVRLTQDSQSLLDHSGMTETSQVLPESSANEMVSRIPGHILRM